MEARFAEIILSVAINGEQQRGDGGAVLFDAERGTAKYLLLDEFSPALFRDSLREMLEMDERRHFFVVSEKDRQLHVNKMPRPLLAEGPPRDAAEP